MTTYTYKFVPSDEPELSDDKFDVICDGKETNIAIQCYRPDNTYVVNSYTYEPFCLTQHSTHKSCSDARDAAVALHKSLTAAATNPERAHMIAKAVKQGVNPDRVDRYPTGALKTILDI